MGIFHLLTMYGLCFGIMHKAEVVTGRLVALPGKVGPFFARLLDCAFCTGFHCGWLVWLTTAADRPLDPLEGIVWSFASAAFCYAVDSGVRWLETSPGS